VKDQEGTHVRGRRRSVLREGSGTMERKPQTELMGKPVHAHESAHGTLHHLIPSLGVYERNERKHEMNKYLTALLLSLLLFALAACRSMGRMESAAPAGSISVQITETDFHIASSVSKFVPGKVYYFVVTNRGQAMHEFMIMPKAEGSMNGMPMENMDKLALASIPMIDPGETQTLNYTFPASLAGSRPEFACYFSGHYEAGMRLDVAVQAG